MTEDKPTTKRTLLVGLINTLLLTAVLTAGITVYWALTF